MIELDKNAKAFVNHYRHLPIFERMLLSVEKQVALFGREGARIAGILDNAGTKNGAAVQHYYGDKDKLIFAAFLYRYKAYNDWAAQYLKLMESPARPTLGLNTYLLGLMGAWAYVSKHTLPYCYYGGFIQKMGLYNPGTTGLADAYNWSGPIRVLVMGVTEQLSRALGEELALKRMNLGAAQLVSSWSAKERELRQLLSDKAITFEEASARIDHFSVEMTEALSANLLREQFKPFPENPLPLLEESNRLAGEPKWCIRYEDGSE